MSADAGDPARAAARRRHPSTRRPVTGAQIAGRLADRLERAGARWASIGAALVQERARRGLTVHQLAAELAVDTDELRRAEAGTLSLGELPRPVRHLLLRCR